VAIDVVHELPRLGIQQPAVQVDAPASALLHHEAGDIAVLRFVPAKVFGAGVVGGVEGCACTTVQAKCFCHEGNMSAEGSERTAADSAVRRRASNEKRNAARKGCCGNDYEKLYHRSK